MPILFKIHLVLIPINMKHFLDLFGEENLESLKIKRSQGCYTQQWL